MNTVEVNEKIKKYEDFIENKLKKDLGEIETTLNIKRTKYEEWVDIQDVLKTVKEFHEKDRDMVLRVEVGNDVHITGEINEFQTTYINIGLGYILEMDCEEANKYSVIRKRLLEKEIAHYRNLAVDVKVHIKLVLLAINELQSTLLIKPIQKLNL